MAYSIRRWMSSGGMLFDDSTTAKTADEAVAASKRLAGICKSLITDDVAEKIMSMEPGELIKIKRPSLKFTLQIRRTKR